MMSIHYSNNATTTAGSNSRATNGNTVRGRTESPRSRHTTYGAYDTPTSLFTTNPGGPATKSNLLNRRTPSQQKQYTETFVNDDYDTYEEDSYIRLNNRNTNITQPLSNSNNYGVKRNVTGQQASFQLQSLNNPTTNYIYNHNHSTLMQPSSHNRANLYSNQSQQQKPITIQQRPRVSDLAAYSYNTSKVGGNTTSTVGVPKYTHSIVNSNSSNLHSNSAELIHKNLDNLNLNDSRQAYQQDSQTTTTSMGTGYAGAYAAKNFRTRRSQFNLLDGTNTTSTGTSKPMMTNTHLINGAYSNGHAYGQQHLQSNMSNAYSSSKNVNSTQGITQFYANQYQPPAYKSNNQNHLLPSPSSTSSSSSSSPPLHISSSNTANNGGYGGSGGYTYGSGATQFYGTSNSSAQNYGNEIDTRGIVGLKNLGNTVSFR